MANNSVLTIDGKANMYAALKLLKKHDPGATLHKMGRVEGGVTDLFVLGFRWNGEPVNIMAGITEKEEEYPDFQLGDIYTWFATPSKNDHAVIIEELAGIYGGWYQADEGIGEPVEVCRCR